MWIRVVTDELFQPISLGLFCKREDSCPVSSSCLCFSNGIFIVSTDLQISWFADSKPKPEDVQLTKSKNKAADTLQILLHNNELLVCVTVVLT